MLRGMFLRGSDLFIPNDYYQICAYPDQLVIIDVLNPSKKYTLEYSQIYEFRKQNLQNNGKACFISYEGKGGTHDLLFQINPLKDGYDQYNVVANAESLIFNYVTGLIKKNDNPVRKETPVEIIKL